jgi:hypothetical protein
MPGRKVPESSVAMRDKKELWDHDEIVESTPKADVVHPLPP